MTTSRRLQAAERAALGELYPVLRRFAAVAGPLDVDPDELLGEALAKTARHHQLAATEVQVDRLRRAILRAASGHRHRLGTERRSLARLHVTGDGVEPIYTDVAELLRLSPTVRALLYLVDIEGMEPERVAACVGTSVEAVITTTDRARMGIEQKVGSTEALVRAFERLSERGRRPNPESVVEGAERRMAATPLPKRTPPRSRLSTRGWRKRRSEFDRNVQSMAAGAAVAVFLLSAGVIGGLLFSIRGGDDSVTTTTRAAVGSPTTTVATPSAGRIVGWQGVGEADATVTQIATAGGGFLAWGAGPVFWSPDGTTWQPVEGPAPGAGVAVAGELAVALDPPTPEEGALLWRSDDGGRTWAPVTGSSGAIPRIPGVIVTIGELRAAATDESVLAAARLRAVVDWPALLAVEPTRLSTGTVDGRAVVWLSPEDASAGERTAFRLDAIASGSQITLRAVTVADGEQAFELRGTAGVMSTATASSVLVEGGDIGTAVWRAETGGRFERVDDLPAPFEIVNLIGGLRYTVVTDGSAGSDAIWSSQDGETWEAVRSGRPFETETLLDVARDGDDWVAVTVSETGVSFWASVDGRFWFRADEGSDAGATSASITSSSSGWTATVLDDDGTSIYWSANGADWAIQVVPNRELLGAVSTRAGVIAVDSAGAVWLGTMDS